MGFAITTMSANGQVVIPAEIRQEAGIKPAQKFLVISEGKEVHLEPVEEKELLYRLRLMRDIMESEEDIRAGRTLTVDASLPTKEIMKRLLNYKCGSSSRKSSSKASTK